MCCAPKAKEKQQFLADMKKRRRKTFTAWRTCLLAGQSEFARPPYYYRPGANYALAINGRHWRGKYDPHSPRGLHCFVARKEARAWWESGSGERIVPVQCHVNDLVVMGYGELVMRKVTILKKDWPKSWKVKK